MSKVADVFRRPLVLIETPVYFMALKQQKMCVISHGFETSEKVCYHMLTWKWGKSSLCTNKEYLRSRENGCHSRFLPPN